MSAETIVGEDSKVVVVIVEKLGDGNSLVVVVSIPSMLRFKFLKS